MVKRAWPKRLALILSALSLLTLLGCQTGQTTSSSTGQEPPEREPKPRAETRISVAFANPATSLTAQLLKECAWEWEERSGGTVDVNIFSGGRLGNDALLLEAAIQGTVSVVRMDVNLFEEVIPEASLVGIPYTFDSPEEYNALMQGEYGDVFQSYYEAAGLRLLNTTALSWKCLTSNVRLKEAADLEKLKIRVFDNDSLKCYWSSCGAQVDDLAFSELYMALHDNTFNSQENSQEAVITNSLYEVQDYLYETRHMLTTHAFVMNLEQYNALTPEVQEALEAFLNEFTLRYRREVEGTNEKELQELVSKGQLKVQPLPEAVRTALVQGREPVIQSLRELLGDQTVDQFLEAVKKTKNDF